VGKKTKRRAPKPVGPKHWEARASGRVITFTREDILVRLINTAIALWFHKGDMLSIHMLAAASYKALCDLAKKRGIVPWLSQIISERELTIAYDFLRHASSDLSIVLDFPPSSNLPLLACAITTFEDVFSHRTSYMSVLMLRFLCGLPTNTPETRAAFGNLASKYFPQDFVVEDFAKLQGAEFFDKALKLVVGRQSND
jgi:hypothetical protein